MRPTIDERCDGCGRCVRDCVYDALRLEGGAAVARADRYCSACGHCVAICPADAVRLEPLGPPAMAGALPAPEQVEALIAARRSVRAFRPDSVPRPLVDRLLAAAAAAPSGCNARRMGISVVLDPYLLRALERQTAVVSRVLARALLLPGVAAALQRAPLAAVRRAAGSPVVAGAQVLCEGGTGERPWVTLGAPVLLLFHAPPDAPTPAEDCCIAADHVTLLARALGLGTCWNGVVVETLGRAPWLRWRARIPRGARVYAALSVGWPAVRYQRPAPRAPIPVRYV